MAVIDDLTGKSMLKNVVAALATALVGAPTQASGDSTREKVLLKFAVAVLTVALAGTAGAANWKDLRIDASSEPAFSPLPPGICPDPRPSSTASSPGAG